MTSRILVVEDDPTLRRVLHDSLQFEGFEVECAVDARTAIDRADAASPDLVLLDLMLPDIDGFEVCRLLRRQRRTPIIMLTARSQKADKLQGLACGADDYVSKPFDFDELLARIQAVLRRTHAEIPSLRLGDLVVDFGTLSAVRGSQEVHLTHREYEILEYLAVRQGQVVSRNELLTRIWSYADAPITRSVDQAIARLRKKIEPNPRSPRYLHSGHGEGYCLTPEGL